MNILFVNYGDLLSNSISHIIAYADALAKKGHLCAVAVDELSPNPEQGHPARRILSYKQLDEGAEAFPNGRPADIIHAWTPRENTRRSVQSYRSRYINARLVIHLEDNEDAILESYYQKTINALRYPSPEDTISEWHLRLSHPIEYKKFLASCDGVTLLAPSLADLLPIAKKQRLIHPILATIAKANDRNSLLGKYNLPQGIKLIVYPGGITSNNREDVRDLYIAVKQLNDAGHATLIVKTGPSCSVFENSFDFPLGGICRDLGYVDHAIVKQLISVADVLVQPGRDNAFNRDRLPCKIPEFLSSGRPCIVPECYKDSEQVPSDCALFLKTSSPEEIAERCAQVFEDEAASASMGQRAQAYSKNAYAPEPNANSLLAFYEGILNTPTSETGPKYYREAHACTKKPESKKPTWISFFKGLFAGAASDKRTEPKHKDTPPAADHPCYHRDYHLFCRKEEEHVAQYLDEYANQADRAHQPLISILLPVYNVEERWLRACIDSVLRQAYRNWELCIADDSSTKPHIASVLREYEAKDERINFVRRETNGHISLATNTAFSISSGDYLALLDHDDELAPHALAKVVEVINQSPQAKIIYSDEDKIDENGIRHGPHFKSDWNYDLFLGCNMISHLGVYKRDAFEQVGGFRVGYEGAQDWDLALRIAENCQNSEIVHIPHILYHWRSIQGSTAVTLEEKNYASQAQKRALGSHFERKGIEARLESVEGIHWRVIYPLPRPQPKVSIIIPTKDRVDILKPCIDSILQKTRYENYEILIVDNDSNESETQAYFQSLEGNENVRIIKYNGSFNYSAINNYAAQQNEAEVIALLNNDTEVIAEDWLEEMVSHAMRPNIGAVGAKLLFPHEHVQHCGVIMGIGGVAGHAFKFLHREDDGYIHRAQITSCYAAVTGACMTFRKSLWQELKGLNESELQVAYSDVDFCLRALEAGYRNIVTPFALLYHKESETRKGDASPEAQELFAQESGYMHEHWGSFIARDPYYNPNLTKQKEDFSYNIEG